MKKGSVILLSIFSAIMASYIANKKDVTSVTQTEK